MNIPCAFVLSEGGAMPMHAGRVESQVRPLALQNVALRSVLCGGSHHVHTSPAAVGCTQSTFPPFVLQSPSAPHAALPQAASASQAAMATNRMVFFMICVPSFSA